MNEEKTPQPEADQLLKVIEMQMAASRARRITRESSRSRTGVIGIVVIVVGAAVALWMLLIMLEQMRPEHREQAGASNAETK
jgi:hypothetical protein